MLEKLTASYWLKAGSFSLLSQFSNAFFGFINFYLLLRILNKTDFGVWTLFITVATLMELVKNGFITTPLVRYSMVEDKKEYVQILSSSILLNVLVSTLQISIIIPCSFILSDLWSSPQLQKLFVIFIAATLLLIPSTHFSAIQQANMNFKGNFYSNVSRQFTFFAFVSLSYVFHIHFELWQLAVVHSFSVLVSVFVAFFNVKKFLTFSFVLSKKWIINLTQYGKYTLGTNISATVFRNMDTWMLGAILTPGAVTIYTPAIRVSNIVEVPTTSLSTIYFPKLLSSFAEGGISAAKDMYEKSVAVLLAFMFPVVIVCIILAGPIILIIAGPEYEETVGVLRITMITGLFVPFNRQFGITLDAMGKASTNFYFVLLHAVLNAILIYFGIRYFGIIGAAYGMLLTFILNFIYNQLYIRYLIGVDLLNVFRMVIQFQRKFILFVFKFLTTGKI